MGFDFSRRQWLTIVVISIADFCNAICVALQAPFYPQEAEKKGCTATEFGLVFGVFELVVFLVSPIYGAHLNKLGPKLLFNGGILTTGTCAILFGMLDKVEGHVPFITLSFIIRIVEAMGNAAFLTASFAIIAKEFPNNVATMFASLETFFGLGLIVGPTLGGALYDFGGYSLPFAVLGSALFCAAVMSCLVLPKSHDDEDLKPSGPSMLSLLKVPGVLLSALSIMMTSMSIGFLQATLEPHLRQFQFSSMVLGLMFVINGGVYAVSAPGWGWLCDHPAIKQKYVIAVGCAFVSAGFLLIGPAPFFDMETQMWAVILGLMLHGLGMGSQLVASFSDALGTAIASGLPNSIETYGLVSGMWTSTFALGAFIGPTVSGLLFDSIGFRSSTLFVFILHLVVMVMMLMFTWTCDRSSKMDVSVSAGDLLQIDGTLDESVLIGDKFLPPPRTKRWASRSQVEDPLVENMVIGDNLQEQRTRSRRCGISVEQSRPPAMNSLIACSSYKNRRSPWSQRTPRYRPTYGSLDHRYRGAYNT
ncbi:MFS-type transporter SLC18B1-like isoform X2 [Spodoptera frugiperda]|uniref:MFS-type transporter SLC18B1-like isoform X1 n=1 Tax=Spodoptera frugiperda TaxID=7108 RepID=A0A9R0DUX8_SPOFR|nr:MFS-type transporter SLC18B1-like isoform X1 [Spodoptera frugiperda]XP_050553713.1 MFS-type transporter SLC18B1-like isoform X2 [Spodoptera frugiperda]